MSIHPPVPPAKGPRAIQGITERNYLRAVTTMRRIAVAARSPDPEEPAAVGAIHMAQDLLSRESLASSTKKAYRSALIWYCNAYADRDTSAADALALLEENAPERGRPRERRNPATISAEDFDALLDALNDLSHGPTIGRLWAQRAHRWCVATMGLGLRPAEWLDAEWLEEEESVRVKTGKVKLSGPAFSKNGAAPEQDRYRILRSDKPAESWAASRLLLALNQHAPKHLDEEERAAKFRSFYDGCRRALRKANLQAFGDKANYSLYSLRSQWFANMKARHGAGVASAMMGHTRDDTPAAMHYAKSNQAHAQFRGGGDGQRPGELMNEREEGFFDEVDHL
jgi:integrase